MRVDEGIAQLMLNGVKPNIAASASIAALRVASDRGRTNCDQQVQPKRSNPQTPPRRRSLWKFCSVPFQVFSVV